MMKYELDFTNMPDYVAIRTEGVAEIQGFIDLVFALVNSPEWIVGTKQLVDHRSLDMSGIDDPHDIDTVSCILSQLFKKLGNGRRAFVVKGASGLMAGNYYCNLAEQDNCEAQVFDNMTEAQNWILSYCRITIRSNQCRVHI